MKRWIGPPGALAAWIVWGAALSPSWGQSPPALAPLAESDPLPFAPNTGDAPRPRRPVPRATWESAQEKSSQRSSRAPAIVVEEPEAVVRVPVGQVRIVRPPLDFHKEAGSALEGPPKAPEAIVEVAGPPGPLGNVEYVGDSTIVRVDSLIDGRIAVHGLRLGSTTFTAVAEGEPDANRALILIQVDVVLDEELVAQKLADVFPEAAIRVRQVGQQVVVDGQARDHAQAARVMEMVRGLLDPNLSRSSNGGGAGAAPTAPSSPDGPQTVPGDLRVVNLIQVPGSQQVLLHVQIAELDRTAARRVGVDVPLLLNLSGANASALAGLAGGGGGSGGGNGSGLVTGNVAGVINLLRSKGVLKILSEPNLVAISGQEANFLAGGEFPVPVPQSGGGGGGGGGGGTTVQFREYGVRLRFLPIVLDDGTVRLRVEPEVSAIDKTVGTTLVRDGDPVPGLLTRRASTTVEMREGQALAIAGLLALNIEGNTSRIPMFGDLPVIGAFFSNTTSARIEKELIVLVSPRLIDPLDPGQCVALPGAEVREPTNGEFFLSRRLESRRPAFRRPFFRTTVKTDAPIQYDHAPAAPDLQTTAPPPAPSFHGPFGFEP